MSYLIISTVFIFGIIIGLILFLSNEEKNKRNEKLRLMKKYPNSRVNG